MCIIFIANIGNLESCKLFAEDGTGLVKNIHEAYEHLNAIETRIDSFLDQEYLGEDSLIAFINQDQLTQLKENAVAEMESGITDKFTQQKFKELFKIIEMLQS